MMEQWSGDPVQPDVHSAETADDPPASRGAAKVLNVPGHDLARVLEAGQIRFTMDAGADQAARELVELSQEMGLYDVGETGSPGRSGISAAQMAEILRRSEAYHRNPEVAVPLEEALERIERSLDDLLEDTSKLDGPPA